MRKKNYDPNILAGIENSLNLVPDDNQLQETKNQNQVATPRQDKEIISLIISGEIEAAKEKAASHYLTGTQEVLKEAYPFLENTDYELAFDKATDEVIVLFEGKEQAEADKEVIDLKPKLEKDSLDYIKTRLQHKSKNREDYQFIQAIMNSKNNRELSESYEMYRNYFIGFARKNFPKCNREIIADAYQDALIVLIEDYIRTERFCLRGEWIFGLRKSTKLSTFIVSIGRRMLARSCNIGKQKEFLMDDFDPEMPVELSVDRSLERKLIEAIQTLSKKCRRLLFYRYWLGLSHEEIKEITEARSAGSVRVMTLRCRAVLEKYIDLNFED